MKALLTTLWMAAILGAGPSYAGASRASRRKPVAPYFVSSLTQEWMTCKKRDGELAAISTGAVGGQQGVVARFSRDNGRTWGPVRLLLSMPARFASPEPFVDQKGNLQLFFLVERKKTYDDDGTGMPMGIDLWHTRTGIHWAHAAPPTRIWRGYTGSMNGVLQLKDGRILFPFSQYVNRTWTHRGAGAHTYTYTGRGVCRLLYSNDDGATWTLSPDQLTVETPDLDTDEGAIEPVITQLNDGTVWMLLRTQWGRFYQSWSQDGINWSRPVPSLILSSDSPAGLVHMDDGRIVLLWNDCERHAYAYGGRQVLHGAVTADDGKTWQGFREVVRDPKRDEPPPPTGDHGTAYPIAGEADDGMIISSDGIGQPDQYTFMLDPSWLLQTSQQDDFSHGLTNWSAYGVKGVELVDTAALPGRRVLAIRKPDSSWPSGAEWNFPCGVSGALHMRLMVEPGFKGALIGLTDQFSDPFDHLDRFNNLYNLNIGPGGRLTADHALVPGRWHDLVLYWSDARHQCRVLVDGRQVESLPLTRNTLGVNYVRIRSTAMETDPAGLLIASVSAHVTPEGSARGR